MGSPVSRASARFPLRFGRLRLLLATIGMTRGTSAVVVGESEVECRAGPGGVLFRLRAPRTAIARAAVDDRRVWSWGVHGWRGRWLVNGASRGIVRIDLDPPVRGWVVGLPVRVRELQVSVDDPDGLVAAFDRP